MDTAHEEWTRLNSDFYDAQAERVRTGDESLLLRPEYFERQWSSYRDIFGRMTQFGGRTVLDCGCGTGVASCWMALHGAEVIGVDVSPRAIDVARERASVNEVQRTRFLVCDACALPIPDASVDIVAGVDILHHLPLEAASREFLRILRPGGTGTFHEPISLLPLVRAIRKSWLVRRIVPVEGLEGERQVEEREIAVLRQLFTDVRVAGYQILSRLDRVVRRRGLRRAIGRLDTVLLRAVPGLTPLARWAVITFRKRP
ncbi:MAG: methyltransferase domain-containing protein [Planctomycetes bacterium]|nr:methyltransferase domain-containing protein [Planctomycetota bacterium]